MYAAYGTDPTYGTDPEPNYVFWTAYQIHQSPLERGFARIFNDPEFDRRGVSFFKTQSNDVRFRTPSHEDRVENASVDSRVFHDLRSFATPRAQQAAAAIRESFHPESAGSELRNSK